MNETIVLALFSGVGVMSGLFAACYFFLVKNETWKSRFLGLIFIALSLRIGKSIFYYLYPDMSLFGISLGFLGLSCIGPLALLYLRSDMNFNSRELMHFIFPVAGFISILTVMHPAVPYYAYLSGTFILLAYIGVLWFAESTSNSSWDRWLLISLMMIGGALLYQLYSDGILDYAYGAAFAALMVYVLLFKMFMTPSVVRKKQPIQITKEVINKVVHFLEADKGYQQADLNVNGLAARVETPAYLVSKAIKRHYGKAFPEVINSLRVGEVKKRLLTLDESDKIEWMAYDVGFNTPSAFYAAFKKETNSSPREFQKAHAG